MGKKVFISYKYGDTKVARLGNNPATKVRDYVDFLQDKFEETPHIYKAEEDGNDLSEFTDETIESKLRDKIYDSSITVVLISRGMKEMNLSEDEQWIPWEVSYSLKEHTRNGRTSGSNGLLGVVIPDETDGYEFLLRYDYQCNAVFYNDDNLFKILTANMFNLKKPDTTPCNGRTIHSGEYSYFRIVRWRDFVGDINKYVDICLRINDHIGDYNIVKTVD